VFFLLFSALHWGKCKDGSSKVGCGDQTEIYNCADIAILPAGQNSQQSNIVQYHTFWLLSV
jgi:hypothetical protein